MCSLLTRSESRREFWQEFESEEEIPAFRLLSAGLKRVCLGLFARQNREENELDSRLLAANSCSGHLATDPKLPE